MSEITLWTKSDHLSTQENWEDIAKLGVEWGQTHPGKDFEINSTIRALFLSYESLEDLKNREEVLRDRLLTIRRKIQNYDAD